jgi:hypothetical protein
MYEQVGPAEAAIFKLRIALRDSIHAFLRRLTP